MKSPRRLSQTRDGFTFKKYEGALRWSVHRDSGDESPLIGHTHPNGSRLKSRSWDWKATEGATGKASTRQSAAEAMARHAESSVA